MWFSCRLLKSWNGFLAAEFPNRFGKRCCLLESGQFSSASPHSAHTKTQQLLCCSNNWKDFFFLKSKYFLLSFISQKYFGTLFFTLLLTAFIHGYRSSIFGNLLECGVYALCCKGHMDPELIPPQGHQQACSRYPPVGLETWGHCMKEQKHLLNRELKRLSDMTDKVFCVWDMNRSRDKNLLDMLTQMNFIFWHPEPVLFISFKL